MLPQDLGLPSRFKSWRPHQEKAISDLLDDIHSGLRFTGLVAPVGSGKSLTYMAVAQYRIIEDGCRIGFLTSTKALQDQLLRDFSSIGLVDIRGMANYPCILPGHEGSSVEDGPCHDGENCSYQSEEFTNMPPRCPYFKAVWEAQQSSLFVTNYKYWLYANNYGKGLGEVDLLVCDEAHNIVDELSSFMSATISEQACRKWAIPTPTDSWQTWANHAIEDLRDVFRRQVGKLAKRQVKTLGLKLKTLVEANPDEWVMEEKRGKYGRFWVWDPITPAQYHKRLFFNVPHVLLASATLRKADLHYMGIADNNARLHEYPHTFPVRNRPVYFVPSARVRYDADLDTLKWWVVAIDRIIDSRTDRKGIIHCHSYSRAQFLRTHSRHKHLFYWHDRGETDLALTRFMKAKGGAILVSPTVTEGLEFPDDECRYQIICKVPFPDSRNLIVKARQKLDKDYTSVLAMQEVMQASGRSVRSKEDWCETFLVDDNFSWFLKKQKLMTRWFRQAIKRRQEVPAPPPL